MKLKLTLILNLLPFIWIYSQSNSVEELKRNPYYEVNIDADSVVEIYNKKTNLRWLKSIKTYAEPENTRTADLIIELDTLNLTYWANLYYQWGVLDAANFIGDAKFIVSDANNNSKNEIYAIQTDNTNGYGVLFENITDSLFNYEFKIADSLAPFYDIGDITNDGILEIMGRCIDNSLRCYKQNNRNSYIDQLEFIYHPFPSVYQPNDVTFYDLDKDGIQEIIYYLDAGGDTVWSYSNHVARYNSLINNYELIYYHRPTPNWFTFGIATGDFDRDGKNNFGTGSIEGWYYVYEYDTSNNVNLEYQVHLETLNAFLTVMSEDMNGNGKNEIWLGSDFSSSLYGGVTRVFVLEPAGNGTYEIIYQIDIRGLFSGIYGRIRYVDVDGDGVKEIFLNNGTLVFCFKYSPERNFYLDFIIDTWDSSMDTYEGTDIADLDSDGIPELIMQKHYYPPYTWQSQFWKYDKSVGVEGGINLAVENFKLYQNYPNPFNPSTNFKFSLPQEAKVIIKIYNILGKEITKLLNETRTSGDYEISWNGTDLNGKEVPSGIYFITLISGKYSKTIKSVLIK